MEDPLDNDLKNRIREVFENYEDTSADEGWLLLREKFPGKAKQRPVAWLWLGSVAAVLLVFFGIGLLLVKKPAAPVTPIAKINKTQPDTALPAKTGQPRNNTGITASTIVNPQQQALSAGNKPAGPGFNNNANKAALPQPEFLIKNQKPTHLDVPSDDADERTANVDNKKLPIAKTGNHAKTDDIINKGSAIKPEVYAAAPVNNITQNQADTSVTANNPVKATNEQPKELFASDNNIQESKKAVKLKSTDRRVRFSVYATTYFNYARGSNSQVNLGAGFTADVKLNDHFKLSTGVSVAQNKLSYASQIPLSTASSNTIATTSTLAATAYKAQGQLLETKPELKNYNANLVGLDIPLNIKYTFNPAKNSTYLSAGVSSGTFINEIYNYNYSISTPVSSDKVPTKDIAAKNNFNGFYFAKTLNFAFGIAYPLNKTNRLIIEPFIKYPLDGLGSQQLRFGSSGVNLKFNFSGKRR